MGVKQRSRENRSSFKAYWSAINEGDCGRGEVVQTYRLDSSGDRTTPPGGNIVEHSVSPTVYMERKEIGSNAANIYYTLGSLYILYICIYVYMRGAV